MVGINYQFDIVWQSGRHEVISLTGVTYRYSCPFVSLRGLTIESASKLTGYLYATGGSGVTGEDPGVGSQCCIGLAENLPVCAIVMLV